MELNSTLSGAVSNKLQVGYTHFDDFRNPMSSPAPAMTIQDGAGSNYIIVGHEPFSINNRLDQKVMQLTNNLTLSKEITPTLLDSLMKSLSLTTHST